MTNYFLLDSGDGQKLESFNGVKLIRPAAQAVWGPKDPSSWQSVSARFTREENGGWTLFKKVPPWEIEIEGIKFHLSLTDFGHVGVFPEHAFFWKWMESKIKERPSPNILNLFAYSGGATLAAAKAGAKVCHLDASKPMVALARENASLNKLEKTPIRWIVEDVTKFLKREINRGVFYDGIILDPPTFGRGAKSEVFKIEREIRPLLSLCKSLLSKQPLFVIFSSHTPGFTPLVLSHLLDEMMHGKEGQISFGEMCIESKTSYSLPSGNYAMWSNNG